MSPCANHENTAPTTKTNLHLCWGLVHNAVSLASSASVKFAPQADKFGSPQVQNQRNLHSHNLGTAVDKATSCPPAPSCVDLENLHKAARPQQPILAGYRRVEGQTSVWLVAVEAGNLGYESCLLSAWEYQQSAPGVWSACVCIILKATRKPA